MAYSPTLGRWTSADPKGYVDGSNLYQNVLSNPINRVDPFGLAAWEPTSKPYEDMNAQERTALRAKLKAAIAANAKKIQEDGTKMDCADVAITSLVEAAKSARVPLRLRYWDAGDWKYKSQADYNSSAEMAADLRGKMNAMSLVDNSSPQKWEDLQAGDLILYDLRDQDSPAFTGHTMICTGKDGNKYNTVEGHIADQPPTTGSYTQEELMGKWNGPVGGRGRFWNWVDIIR